MSPGRERAGCPARAVKDRDTALATAAQVNEQMAKQDEQATTDITKQQDVMKDLNAKIAEKEGQLKTAQGERDVLTRELKDLMTKRAALDQQLHDMASSSASPSRLAAGHGTGVLLSP